jgi:arginyl-tRNA synthetase
MFDQELNLLAEKIQQFLKSKNFPVTEIRWAWIPFNGEWGIATSFFQLASKSFAGEKGNVGQRANEIAGDVADFLGVPDGFSKVEAVNGYLNLYFSPSEYTQRIVDAVLNLGADYGKSEPLPFSFGYGVLTGKGKSNLLLAVRKKNRQ